MHTRSDVDSEIKKLLEGGIIVESEVEWNSPILPVRKKDGGIKYKCVDFR